MCVPNKTEDSKLSMFNMIIGINESKILSKHISFECKCKFVIKIKSGIMINVGASVENIIYMKKVILWDPATCIWKMVNI